MAESRLWGQTEFFVDAFIVAALLCAIVPSMPYLGVLAVLALALFRSVRLISGIRDGTPVFVPDPRDTKFNELAKDLAGRISGAAIGGIDSEIVLAPFCDDDGAFVRYMVDWEPKTGHVVVGSGDSVTRSKANALVKVGCRLPIEVGTQPVCVRIEKFEASRSVAMLSVAACGSHGTVYCGLGAMLSLFYKLYLAIVLGAFATRTIAGFAWAPVIVLALLPVLVGKVCLFVPAVSRFVCGNTVFFLKLWRRFTQNSDKLDL